MYMFQCITCTEPYVQLKVINQCQTLWLVKISDRADQHTMGQENTSAHGIVCIKSAKQRMVMVLFQF